MRQEFTINMKLIISLLFFFTLISSCSTPLGLGSINIEHDKYSVLSLGDIIELQGDTNKYIVLRVSDGKRDGICLKRVESFKRVDRKENPYCSKSIGMEEASMKIVNLERSNYLERRNAYKEYSILKYSSKSEIKVGMVNYISIYSDSIQMSYVNEKGNFAYETIGPSAVKSDHDFLPQSISDTLLWIKASMKWVSDDDLYNSIGNNVGQFNFMPNDTIVVNAQFYENSDENSWKILAEGQRSKKCNNPDDQRDFSAKYYWTYKEGILNIRGFGNVYINEPYFDDYMNKEKYTNYIDLSLKPIEFKNSGCSFLLLKKDQKIFKDKKNYHAFIELEYLEDSIPLIDPVHQYLRFGDLITLKEDNAQYHVMGLNPWELNLVNIKTNRTKEIRKRTQSESFKVDKILQKDYKNLFTIKQKYPLHTKVLIDDKQDAFIKKNLFDEQIHLVGAVCDLNSSRLVRIPFGEAVLANQRINSICDTLEYIYASQFWGNENFIFKMHSSYTGGLNIRKGDEITLHNPLYKSIKRGDSRHEYLRLSFMDHSAEYSFGDIFNRSIGKAELKGIWFISGSILNIWVLGTSYTFSENLRSNYKNSWSHKISLEISDLNKKSITYKLIDLESEFVERVD